MRMPFFWWLIRPKPRFSSRSFCTRTNPASASIWTIPFGSTSRPQMKSHSASLVTVAFLVLVLAIMSMSARDGRNVRFSSPRNVPRENGLPGSVVVQIFSFTK